MIGRQQQGQKPSFIMSMRWSSLLARGRVHPVVFFRPEALQNQKGESHHRQSHVMMPASPGSPFKMVQPQFIFQLLVVLLNPPADFGPINQFMQSNGLWQIGEPIFYGLRLWPRPFDEQPTNRFRRFAVKITDGGLDADGREAATHRPFCPCPPRAAPDSCQASV